MPPNPRTASRKKRSRRKAVATTARKAARGLQDLANVGPATLADLHTLGIRSVAQLARQDPLRLHRALRRRTRVRHDPCVIDVFMAIIHQAKGGRPKAWWKFTVARKRLLLCGPGQRRSSGTGRRRAR